MAKLNWEIRGDYAYITYSDGETIKVSKAVFNRAFRAIINVSKEDVKRDFAVG